jgi:hypothetical protein
MAGFGQKRTLFTFDEKNMTVEIIATVLDDEKILFDGHTLFGKDEVADALKLALENDPGFILVIASKPSGHYKGIGTIIYAGQRVGMPIQNMRLTMDDGELVTFEELKARNSTTSM